MSRQLEAQHEEKQRRLESKTAQACNGALEEAVDRMGGELTGLSAKISYGDCLITLRAVFPGGKMVAFLGGDTLGSCLRKAVDQGRSDDLRWKEDKWG